jgi:hypothetical protein
MSTAQPAYSRELVARRNAGAPVDSAFVAVGWPTPWLRELVEGSPHCKRAAILATPENKRYDFAVCVGLSVCLWCEMENDAPRAREIADMVMTADPLRLFILNVTTGETTFLKTASPLRGAA